MTQQQLAHYQIKEKIGEGSFAWVYRAFDQKFQRDVALKILKPVWLNDPEAIANFKQEALTMAKLRHPHIVDVYDVGDRQGQSYLAQMLVRGESLAQRLERGRLLWAEMLEIVRAIASALDYAHAQGLVHRDIKPANILLGRNGRAYLGDFGLVRAAEGSASISASVNMVGTGYYMAPEVWNGEEPSPATDIYALSCVVAEMLTGQILFEEGAMMAVMKKHANGPQFPAAWPADVPAGIEEILAKGLARDPAQRYGRAGQLAAALAALEPASKKGAIPKAGVGGWPPWVWIGGAAVMLALVGGLSFFLGREVDDVSATQTKLAALSLTPAATPTLDPDATSFSYPVRVQNRASGDRIRGAKVTIEVVNKASLEDVSDVNGLARIFVPVSYADRPGVLIVEAEGYRRYRQHIDLSQDALPAVVPLEALSTPSPTATATRPASPTFTPTSTPTVTSTPTPTAIPEAVAPIIEFFGGDPASLVAGEADEVTLSWSIKGEVTEVQLDSLLFPEPLVDLPTAGALPIAIEETTVFILSAFNRDKETRSELEIEVVEPRPTATETATLTPTATAVITSSPTVTPTATPTLEPTPTPTLTPVPTAAFSGKLAIPLKFGEEFKVYVTGFDGAGINDPSRLVSLGHAMQPMFRRDGRQIVVNGTKGEFAGLFVTDEKGGAPRLINNKTEAHWPVWSPDGSEIIFVDRTRKSGLFRQSSQGAFSEAQLVPVMINGVMVTGENVLWTEDNRLVWYGCADWFQQPGECGVWVGNADDLDPKERLVIGGRGLLMDARAGLLVYMSDEDGDWDIYVISLDGGQPENLTNNDSQDGLASIAPDGRSVAYISDESGAWALWTVTLSSGKKQAWFKINPESGTVDIEEWSEYRLSWGR